MPRGRRKPAPSGRCGLKTNAGGISVFPMLARLRRRESGALASCMQLECQDACRQGLDCDVGFMRQQER